MIWEDGNPHQPSSSCSALGASSSKASGWPGTSIPNYPVALTVLFLGLFLVPVNVGLGQGSFLGSGLSGWAFDPLVQALTPPVGAEGFPARVLSLTPATPLPAPGAKVGGLLQTTQPGRPEAEGATG